MIRSISNSVDTADVLPNYNHCILHFLNLENPNLMKQYIKLAWSQGSIGANHLYLVNIEADNKQVMFKENRQLGLNFSEIFDFERLIIVSSYGVGM